LDYQELCGKIEKSLDNIRFAGVINNKGRLVAGGMIGSVKPLEDTKKDEMLFMELALRVRMRGEFNEELGPVKFSLSYREKLIIMSFPMGNDVLLVTIDKTEKFDQVPFKILEIIG
jgi:hypothetical protein